MKFKHIIIGLRTCVIITQVYANFHELSSQRFVQTNNVHYIVIRSSSLSLTPAGYQVVFYVW